MESEIEQIYIKKEREKEYDQKIRQEWRKARVKFYTKHIHDVLRQAKIGEGSREKIINSIIECRHFKFNLQNVKAYETLITKLMQQFWEQQLQFMRKRQICLPLHSVTQKQITSLKVINIEYQQSIRSLTPYHISSFELFKVIHYNKLLEAVSLKGVNVLSFKQFLKELNPSNAWQLKQTQELTWIKSFVPSKLLKLTIDTFLQFSIHTKPEKNKQQISGVNDLIYFQKLFKELSYIKVAIRLQQINKAKSWESILVVLWKCLSQIKQIRIQLEAYKVVQPQQVSNIRSLLFGGLSFLKDINSLSLKKINLSYFININHYLAIEQILYTVLTNNKLTHLSIDNCEQYFIYFENRAQIERKLRNSSLVYKPGIISNMIQNNPSLRSIQCFRIKQEEIRIEEKTFNVLSTLILKNCQRVTFILDWTPSPSTIKHLQIQTSTIYPHNYLPLIFPKLAHLKTLDINIIGFDYEVIRLIPSKSLQYLNISNNDMITDICLEKIDLRWPNLKFIGLSLCKKITHKIWGLCKFQKLLQLSVSWQMLGMDTRILQQLKTRGIRVDLW